MRLNLSDLLLVSLFFFDSMLKKKTLSNLLNFPLPLVISPSLMWEQVPVHDYIDYGLCQWIQMMWKWKREGFLSLVFVVFNYPIISDSATFLSELKESSYDLGVIIEGQALTACFALLVHSDCLEQLEVHSTVRDEECEDNENEFYGRAEVTCNVRLFDMWKAIAGLFVLIQGEERKDPLVAGTIDKMQASTCYVEFLSTHLNCDSHIRDMVHGIMQLVQLRPLPLLQPQGIQEIFQL
ncbi:hypothetical protein VNO77_03105 [Canavalia gladiata]|uniref:Uncharacterized protein n=1 Tax=Canavalia gladiata TaxID=3824 RepID=A0AAN9MZS8_CANGL